MEKDHGSVAGVQVKRDKEWTSMLNDKEVIELQKWWMGEVSKITQRLLNEETRRQEKIKKKNQAMMGEYQTERDIMDAYGCGVISDSKKNRLLDLLYEQEKIYPGQMHQAKIDLLTELYQQAKTIVREKESAIT